MVRPHKARQRQPHYQLLIVWPQQHSRQRPQQKLLMVWQQQAWQSPTTTAHNNGLAATSLVEITTTTTRNISFHINKPGRVQPQQLLLMVWLQQA